MKPIIFSGEMVRAILDGRKTQTRRVIKPQPVWREAADGLPACWQWSGGYNGQNDRHPLFGAHGEAYSDSELSQALIEISPRKPGDLLWVREAWGFGCRPCPRNGWRDGIEYRADEAYIQHYLDDLPLHQVDAPDDFEWGESSGWRSPIFMPKWASRLTLRVTEVRAQQVQDISEADIQAEGISIPAPLVGIDMDGNPIESEHCDKDPWWFFAQLWDSLNAKRGHSWDSNPWVWAISFEVVK